MYALEIRTGLPRFLRDLRSYQNELSGPVVTECLKNRLVARVEGAMEREATRAGIRDARRIITDRTLSPRLATVGIQGNSRGAQLMAMMARGGTVKIPSPRMRTMVIIRDRRFTASTVRARIDQVLSSGRRWIGASEEVWSLKINGFYWVVAKTDNGTTLFRRRTSRETQNTAIAFLPNSARFRRSIFFDRAIERELSNAQIDEVADACLVPAINRSFTQRVYDAE